MDGITWGVAANSHDASISVVQGKEILFAAHAERYSGKKNDAQLNDALVRDARQYGKPDLVVWYEKPWLKTLRQLRAGQGLQDNRVKHYLHQYGIEAPIKTVRHHKSHAAGGYFTSPFTDAAVLVIDAIGEFDTTTIWHGRGSTLTQKFGLKYPHSLGLWYSAMTDRLGLRANEEEYILMGMAAFGDKHRYFESLHDDFFTSPLGHLSQNLHRGCREWRPDIKTEQDKFDLAASVQYAYEMMFQRLLGEAKTITGSPNIVLGGGCALNCVANVHAHKFFENVWIIPNPGDAGNSLGAIAAFHGQHLNWTTASLGFDIKSVYPVSKILHSLRTDKIVGVANGRAEFGPRALGNRSLLADPRDPHIKSKVNEIKRRQQFRPFAPAILAEYAQDYFDLPYDSPYMQYAVKCKQPEQYPAIVHVDGTSRVQTVSQVDNPAFHNLLSTWYEETGCPMLLNTSLNVRGMPLVNTTYDAQFFSNLYRVDVHS